MALLLTAAAASASLVPPGPGHVGGRSLHQAAGPGSLGTQDLLQQLMAGEPTTQPAAAGGPPERLGSRLLRGPLEVIRAIAEAIGKAASSVLTCGRLTGAARDLCQKYYAASLPAERFYQASRWSAQDPASCELCSTTPPCRCKLWAPNQPRPGLHA